MYNNNVMLGILWMYAQSEEPFLILISSFRVICWFGFVRRLCSDTKTNQWSVYNLLRPT